MELEYISVVVGVIISISEELKDRDDFKYEEDGKDEDESSSGKDEEVGDDA